MDFTFLSQFIDANKIGGWVRAGVASLLGVALAKVPGLGDYLSPATQAEIGVVASMIAVGIWSQLTKTDKAKLQAAAEVVDPKTGEKPIIVASPEMAAATPDHANIVSNTETQVVQK